MEGHRRGLARTKEIVDECLNIGVRHCTLWCFSTENWQRNQKEVNYLMHLLEEYLLRHVRELHEKGVKIVHIGRKDRLAPKIMNLFSKAEALTRDNSMLTLCLAIDYGGRDEIIRAIKKGIEKDLDFTEENFSLCLDTAGLSDPDLIIRTSGEQRLSGFMLWQSSHSELYFTETCFPDFTVPEFNKALEEYSLRNRTRGK